MVKVYVNWQEREILTEDEYKDLKDIKIRIMTDKEDEFKDWLNTDYSASEIFDMSTDERLEIHKRWDEYCADEVQDNLDYYWDEVEIEVD